MLINLGLRGVAWRFQNLWSSSRLMWRRRWWNRMRGCIIANLLVGMGLFIGFIRGSVRALGARINGPIDPCVLIPADVALLKSMQRAYGRLGIRLAG